MKPSFSLAVIGPGRAGGALAIAAQAAGHGVQTVAGPSGAMPTELEATRVDHFRQLTACDLVILACPDDAIEQVAEDLAAHPPLSATVAHLSGFASIARLAALRRIGRQIGSLHPLQTLPSPRRGARSLAGSAAAVTAETEQTAQQLSSLAESLGMAPFPLDDRLKPLYHAGAATVALGLATALGVAADLFEASTVPWRHARPLAAQVLENCFRMGPDQSLTGPVVRSDLGTIGGHLRAAADRSPALAQQYRILGQAAAARLNAVEITGFLETSNTLPDKNAECREK